MNARFVILLVFGLTSLTLAAQQSFENKLDELLKKQDYKNASVGIQVTNLETGENVYSLNPNRLFIPASTMKLVSSASALEILGADYRFKTVLGYLGKVKKNGTLEGDLLVKGGADPALGSEYFSDYYFEFLKNWAKQIKAVGIEKVNGNLVMDGSIFDSEKIPATWIWEDIGNYYGVGPNAFTVYDNMFRITFQSPAKVNELTNIIATYPIIEGMSITNEVRSSEKNVDNAYVFGSPFDKIRVIRGTIPAGKKAFTIKAAMHNPEEILAADFRTALAAEGIFVRGDVLFEKRDNKNFQPVFTQESPTLAEIAKVLNYESVNLFAEHFLKQIAVEENLVGNRDKAIEFVKEYWQSKDLPIDDIFIEDGSGLSHFNAVSPAFFVGLLKYMENNEVFVNSLPVAGKGTLTRFDSKLFPDNTLQAKSGSMTRVRCYSGYLITNKGDKLAFSLMFNHFSGSHSALIEEIQKLLETIKSEM